MADTRESRAFRRMQNQYHLVQDYMVLDSSSSSNTGTESGQTTSSSAAVRRAHRKERAKFTRSTSRHLLSDALDATTSGSPSSPRKAGHPSVLIKWRSAEPAAQSRSSSPEAVQPPRPASPASEVRLSVTLEAMRASIARATRLHIPPPTVFVDPSRLPKLGPQRTPPVVEGLAPANTFAVTRDGHVTRVPRCCRRFAPAKPPVAPFSPLLRAADATNGLSPPMLPAPLSSPNTPPSTPTKDGDGDDDAAFGATCDATPPPSPPPM
ncbi:hypothetical protein I4F81_009451 [Pyropia yezoensis]|uniref:Uncharacterized protein n=1 Tax=Pyropia yezoensis TaxID=2788 RepID=A0ACC3C9V3_PYRYE|nr:hypothetical protein I4F81_009451 [Neopyropia yezoensis]